MKFYVYNLQFPDYVNEMTIASHRFVRVANYQNSITRLSHRVPCFSEFSLECNTGEHMITAEVECEVEHPSPLAHGAPKIILDDILILLSLFTGREVFASENSHTRVIARDPRPYLCFETLRTSLPQEFKDDFKDIGFEKGIERVLELVHSKSWLERYDGGMLLFLGREIFKFQVLEKAFLMSQIFWEHLYYVEHRKSCNARDLSNVKNAEKMRVLLSMYGFVKNVTDDQKKRIQYFLTNTRNSLVHSGLFKYDQDSQKDAKKFVELTTQLFAKVLGLQPTDVTSCSSWLKSLLSREIEPAKKLPVPSVKIEKPHSSQK